MFYSVDAILTQAMSERTTFNFSTKIMKKNNCFTRHCYLYDTLIIKEEIIWIKSTKAS